MLSEVRLLKIVQDIGGKNKFEKIKSFTSEYITLYMLFDAAINFLVIYK